MACFTRGTLNTQEENLNKEIQLQDLFHEGTLGFI